MEFLNDLTARPLNISEARGTIPAGLFLGRGSSAIEVAVLRSPVRPTTANLRAIWSSRLAGRATPLLVVVLHGQLAALCGPNGDTPPAFPDLDRERVERICRTALSEPDRNAALRFLAAVIPSIDEQLPGLRNEGLFATHELHRGLPQNAKRWTRAREQAERLLPLRAEQLIQSLGYSLELTPGPVCILRAGDQRRAVAVLLDRNESPDLPNERFAQLSPVSYALARADQENLDWVIVAAGASLRLHPVGTGVGTGRRGRAETFTEIHLDLLLPTDSAYLWLLFSAESRPS